MKFKAFQKKIFSDILKGLETPYLFCFDGDSVLLINSGHSCVVSIPQEELNIPLDLKFENKSILKLKELYNSKNIIPCFEGKERYLFVDETDKQIFFDSKLIAYFIDKDVSLADYDLKYHQNVMYFYHNGTFVGSVLHLRSEPIPFTYRDLVEAEEKKQANRR